LLANVRVANFSARKSDPRRVPAETVSMWTRLDVVNYILPRLVENLPGEDHGQADPPSEAERDPEAARAREFTQQH